MGILVGMRGLAAFVNFWLECVAWRPLGILAGMQGLSAFGNFSWNARPSGLWGFYLECGLTAYGSFGWNAGLGGFFYLE